MNTVRAVAFIDGQNLYRGVKQAFGCSFPNYDVQALSRAVCALKGWALTGIRFYTGIPARRDDPFWHGFWAAKLLAMSRSGIRVFTRQLRDRRKTVMVPDDPAFGSMAGKRFSFVVREEKGIDVRIALDMIRLCHQRAYDAALVFSQDQDLSEAAADVRSAGRALGRRVCIASAFPIAAGYGNRRGINGTDWIPLTREFYGRCIDPRDYRPGAGDA
ncbi:MAG: NYN domain-containing protein [Elusimicrobiota bacterium]